MVKIISQSQTYVQLILLIWRFKNLNVGQDINKRSDSHLIVGVLL